MSSTTQARRSPRVLNHQMETPWSKDTSNPLYTPGKVRSCWRPLGRHQFALRNNHPISKSKILWWHCPLPPRQTGQSNQASCFWHTYLSSAENSFGALTHSLFLAPASVSIGCLPLPADHSQGNWEILLYLRWLAHLNGAAQWKTDTEVLKKTGLLALGGNNSEPEFMPQVFPSRMG